MENKKMEYKIDRNIPLPELRWSKWVELAKQMKLGDSVFLKSHNEASALSSTINRFSKRGCTRKVDGGYRVWALENKKRPS